MNPFTLEAHSCQGGRRKRALLYIFFSSDLSPFKKKKKKNYLIILKMIVTSLINCKILRILESLIYYKNSYLFF